MSRDEPGHQWLAWCALLLSGVTFGASFSLFRIAAGSGQGSLELAFRYTAVSAMLVLVPLLAKCSWFWPNRRAFAFCAVPPPCFPQDPQDSGQPILVEMLDRFDIQVHQFTVPPALIE